MATKYRDKREQEDDQKDEQDEQEQRWPGGDDATGRHRRRAGGDGSRRDRPLPGVEVIRRAQRQLAEITGRKPDAVSGFGPTDDGWSMTVEMVELDRIPPSTSVLATYQVTLDQDGRLLEYQRTRRYYRNQADDQ